MPPLNLLTTRASLEARLSKQPPLTMPDSPMNLKDRQLLPTLPRPRSRLGATLLSRITALALTLRNWMSLPKSSECSPTSSMPGQGMMTTSTTPFASTLRCSTAMRMSNKFSTKKEKIKSEQESGMKWKWGDQDDLVLLTSLKRRMMERVGKMETPSEGKNRTKEMTLMMGQDQQRDLGSMNRCSRGTLFERLAGHSSIPICNEPSSSSRTTPSTSKQCDAHQLCHC